jgi:hypothetical protein
MLHQAPVLVEAGGRSCRIKAMARMTALAGQRRHDERKRYGPVIVANQLKASAETSTLSRDIKRKVGRLD